VSPRRAATALRWLGDLHGRWWGRAAYAFPWLETERSFERRLRAAAEANWPAYERLAQAHHVPRRQIQMVERAVARFGEGLTGGLLAPTLIHYDFRVGNMLFAGEDDVVVLDWQSPLVGQGAVDLVWFLGDSIAPDHRRAHGAELVGIYLDRLAANGVAKGDLDAFDRQMRLSRLRALPMSVLLATTFKDLAHINEPAAPAWWARGYDELEEIWIMEGNGR
jgi:aminoglycoside phosphotransferase (APT) family kinase protein